MKGIVLAGGKGTRLYPSTRVISKQLLPIYDKPMIYYPISILMLAGIKDILIISTKEDIGRYRELLGTGKEIGVNFSYKIQEKSNGLAEAFIIGEDFISNDNVCLILGDNIFYGQGLTKILTDVINNNEAASIFGYPVIDPREFGVVEFDDDGNVLSIEEKPKNPKSKYVIPGLYFFDNSVIERAKRVIPSDRGELEITSILQDYLKQNKLKLFTLGRGIAWLDTGSPSNMLKAGVFVETVQSRDGLYIACLEEIAWRKGWISDIDFYNIGKDLSQTDYGKYILRLSKDKRKRF